MVKSNYHSYIFFEIYNPNRAILNGVKIYLFCFSKHNRGPHYKPDRKKEMHSAINFNIIFKVISRNLLITSAFMALCILVAIYFNESVYPFTHSLLYTATIGGFLFFATHKKDMHHEMTQHDAYITVTIAWTLIGFTGSLPYIFSGSIPHFVDAFFESVSGFTTTGSSILTDIEALPKSILFWRSLTHWIGGIGIILLVIILMPSLKMSGYHIFTLESSLQEKIKPKIRKVGYRLFYIYITLTVIEILFLMAGGMNLFESSCHAFGTVATGGFSPKNDSIASYSPYIQYVIMVFMLLAGLNFVIYYYLIKRQFKKIKTNEEVRFYIGILLFVGAILTAALYFGMDKPLETSFREAYFQIISIVTCTGFATADYLLWPHYAIIIIFISMFFGGSTGSTAGGIKMIRHLVLFKNIRRRFKQTLHPQSVIPIRLNHVHLSDASNQSILTFITVYLLAFLFGSFLMTLTGVDIPTATSSIATCMAGIGPGIGSVGPVNNFAFLTDTAKLILVFFMLLGRLEIYTILILFTKNFWKS
jgi:trk system potassium uptake protein TrkH